MIEPKLLKALKEKTGLGQTAIYLRIAQKRRALGYVVSRQQAAILISRDCGVDPSKYVSSSELAALLPYVGQPGVAPDPSRAARSGKIRTPATATNAVVLAKLPNAATVSSPFLPRRALDEAIRMANSYVVMYIFENSLRTLIDAALRNVAGAKWWESPSVSSKIRQKALTRMAATRENRWCSQRGQHPMCYVDLGDLISIVTTNWAVIEPYIKESQDWVRVKLGEIELSRNIVAHHNPLERRDIDRVALYFEDWIRQVRAP